jgi:hypothetical protein
MSKVDLIYSAFHDEYKAIEFRISMKCKIRKNDVLGTFVRISMDLLNLLRYFHAYEKKISLYKSAITSLIELLYYE